MHNIDRTYGEPEFGSQDEVYQEELGFEDGFSQEGDFEFGDSVGQEYEAEIHEEMETELATELLSVANDAEMDQFLGKLFKKAVGAAKGFARSSAGKALGGFLKKAAKRALPVLGSAVGGYFGGPLGAKLGGKLAGAAGQYFGLELEGLSQEDQEFEMAKAFVRFASDAARKAARNPALFTNPIAAAKSAALSAAKAHAPGFINSIAGRSIVGHAGQSSGRWIRKGRKIILLGV